MELNGKLGHLTFAVPETPEPMATKFGVGDNYQCAKFHYDHYDPIRFFFSPPRPHAPARTT